MARYQEVNFKFQTWYLEFLLLASRSPSGDPSGASNQRGLASLVVLEYTHARTRNYPFWLKPFNIQTGSQK